MTLNKQNDKLYMKVVKHEVINNIEVKRVNFDLYNAGYAISKLGMYIDSILSNCY